MDEQKQSKEDDICTHLLSLTYGVPQWRINGGGKKLLAVTSIQLASANPGLSIGVYSSATVALIVSHSVCSSHSKGSVLSSTTQAWAYGSPTGGLYSPPGILHGSVWNDMDSAEFHRIH